MKELSVDDLFLPLLDFIDARKAVIFSSILNEMHIDFPEVDKAALEHNIQFCLGKMLEADIIKQKDEAYQVTRKGTKVLRQRQHKMTLEQIEFYIQHDENYFGRPSSPDHPKQAMSITFKAIKDNPWVQKMTVLLTALILFYVFILRIGIKSIGSGADILTKPFEQGFEESEKAIKKFESQP